MVTPGSSNVTVRSGRAPMSAPYEFGIPGPLAVTRDGRRVSPGAAQPRTLLAALLLDAGRVVPVDALVDRLWGSTRRRGPGTPYRTTSRGCAGPSGRRSYGRTGAGTRSTPRAGTGWARTGSPSSAG